MSMQCTEITAKHNFPTVCHSMMNRGTQGRQHNILGLKH